MFELQDVSSGIAQDALASATETARSSRTAAKRVLEQFEQLRAPVFRYLFRKTQDAARAEDLTQETFLRLCRHLRDDRALENPKALLLTVANNQAIDIKRSEHKLRDLDEATWKEIEESRAGRQPDPEKLLLDQERLDGLHKAVLNLTALQRECLHLRAEGLHYREVGDLLGLSISTVADAVRRATVKLARELESEVSA